MKQETRESVQAIVEQCLTKTKTLGAAVSVCFHGQPSIEMGVGYQDKERLMPLSAGARVYIYSITKSLLSALSLYLVSKKLLDLDVPVQSYLANWPFDAAITTRQLLSHTSGLPDYGAASAYKDAVKTTPREPWSAQDFVRFAVEKGAQFEPGQSWAYSNIGYLFVKRILEQTSGKSLQQLLNTVIINPLRLKHTFFPITLADVKELTPGYTNLFNEGKQQDMAALYHPGWVAHGVMVSTMPELARIMAALYAGQIIEASLIEQMVTPVHYFGKSLLFGNLGYGLGQFIDTESHYGEARGHTGEGPGYSVAAFNFSDLAGSSVEIALMINRDIQDGSLELLYAIADIVAKQP